MTNMSSPQTLAIDEPYFKNGVKQVATKLGFKNYTTKTDKGVRDGVNYVGEIHRLNIEEYVSGDTRKLYLIGKVVGKDEKKRKLFQLNKIAITECHIYNNMFPAFDRLQDKFGVEERFSHPIAHLATAKDHEELILMEDLSKLDPPFGLPKNGKSLDYDHAKLILETLGHFHALSFALKRYNPDVFKELVKVAARERLNTKMDDMLPQMVNNAYQAGIKKYPELKNLIHGFMEDIYAKSNKLSDEPDGHSIICHGDLWSFNLLYSYKGDTPIEVVLIDWQAIQYTSPVQDLLFCLFVCVDEKIRETRIHSFITIYYDSLKRHLEELRCDPNEIYPEDVFHSHIKKYMPSVIFQCLMMLPIFMAEKFDIDSITEEDNHESVKPTVDYPDKFYTRFRQMAKDIEQLLSM